MGMGIVGGMGINLALLLAMVATNILSLYHLSATVRSTPTSIPSTTPPPLHLLRQLSSIRATISRLSSTSTPSSSATSSPSPLDLLLYAALAPIASACHDHPDLLHAYMSYTPFSACPKNSTFIAETLILRGCHPLPRRRCFSRSPAASSLPSSPFPASLPDSAVLWPNYPPCKSFACVAGKVPGFDMAAEIPRFMGFSSNLDLPIPQLLQLAKSENSPIRLGLDVGGGTGTFAARMKLYNATVVTTTLNQGVPYSEAVALRGLVPLHVPLQQRMPVFDGALDLVRLGRAVNRWIPSTVMEFMMWDVDRVLRRGGFLWLDHFFCKREDLDGVYRPMVDRLGYKRLKWAVANKTDGSMKSKNGGQVYLTALLHKPLAPKSTSI